MNAMARPGDCFSVTGTLKIAPTLPVLAIEVMLPMPGKLDNEPMLSIDCHSNRP
jgi:hypothetical protein